MFLDGLITNKPEQVYFESAVLTDLTNNIHMDIRFNPTYENTYTGMVSRSLSWLGGGKKPSINNATERQNRADDMIITVKNEAKEVLFTGHGCWLSHLILDDKEFWRIEETVPVWNTKD